MNKQRPTATTRREELKAPTPPLAHLEPELFGERLSVHEATCALRLEIRRQGGEHDGHPTFILRDWPEQVQRHFPACFSRTAETRVLLTEVALIQVDNPLPVDIVLALPSLAGSEPLVLPACTRDSTGDLLLYRSPLLLNERLRWFGILPSRRCLHTKEEEEEEEEEDTCLLQTTQPAYWYAYREMSTRWLVAAQQTRWQPLEDGINRHCRAPLEEVDAIPVHPRAVHRDWAYAAPIYRVPREDLATIERRMDAHLGPHIGHRELQQDVGWEVAMDPWDLERLAEALDEGEEEATTVFLTFTLRIQCVLLRLGDVYERDQ